MTGYHQWVFGGFPSNHWHPKPWSDVMPLPGISTTAGLAASVGDHWKMTCCRTCRTGHWSELGKMRDAQWLMAVVKRKHMESCTLWLSEQMHGLGHRFELLRYPFPGGQLSHFVFRAMPIRSIRSTTLIWFELLWLLGSNSCKTWTQWGASNAFLLKQ